VPVLDFFTVQNSIDPVNPDGVAAATLNTLHVEWSGVMKSQEYNDPASTFAGTFKVTSATIDLIVTTAAVPAHGIPGFRFVSDDIIANFAEVGQEQNGAFYPEG
jgi:hypothetical protein